MEKFTRSLVSFILNRGTYLVSGILLFTVACFLSLGSLKTDNEINIWFDKDDKTYTDFQDFIAHFGDDRTLFVIYQAPKLFSAQELDLNRRLTQKIQEIEGVERAISLTNLSIPHITPFRIAEKKLIPGRTTNYDKLETTICSQNIFVNNLVSENGVSTGIQIFPENPEDNLTVLREVRVLINQLPDAERYYLVGGIPIFEESTRLSTEEPGLFVGLALLVMLVLLLVIMRSFLIALVPLALCIVAIIWSMAFLNVIGGSINMLTGIVPLVVLVMGIALSIHLISTYKNANQNGMKNLAAIYYTYGAVFVPGTITSLTTAITFVSFSFSDIGPIKTFGISTAMGVVFSYIVTLLLMPLLFKRFPGWFSGKALFTKNELGVVSVQLSRFVVRGRKWIIAISLFIICGALVGVSMIRFEADQIRYFSPTNRVRVANDSANIWFNGVYPFELVFDIQGLGRDSLVALYSDLQHLESRIKEIADVSSCHSVVGLSAGIANMNTYKIPEKTIFSQLVSNSATAKNDQMDQLYLSPGLERLRFVIKTRWIDNQTALKVLADIKETVDQSMTSPELPFYITGTAILLAQLNDLLLKIQIFSLSISFLIILVVFIVVFRKPKFFLYGILPNILPVLLTTGVIGFLGISIDVGTVLVASISLGVAVDDTVYFLTAFKATQPGTSGLTKLQISFQKVWQPITLTSVLLSVGFLLLVFSEYTPVKYLGLFVSLNMILAFVCDVLLLPALLLTKKKAQPGDAQ